MALANQVAASITPVDHCLVAADITEAGNAHRVNYHAEPFQVAGEKLTGVPAKCGDMNRSAVSSGLAFVLGALTVVLAILGVVVSPAVFAVALIFAIATYVVADHASGRLAARVYRRVQRRAGAPHADAHPRNAAGAGPRDDWRGPRRSGAGRRRRGRTAGSASRDQRRTASPEPDITRQQAYQTLGLEPGASEAAVTAAYRDRVKEVHPDTGEGDEETFKTVTSAYERLTD
jgi:hypothetical protein